MYVCVRIGGRADSCGVRRGKGCNAKHSTSVQFGSDAALHLSDLHVRWYTHREGAMGVGGGSAC